MIASASRPSNGFTIVELLIVIVVIAVLASVTVVAFNGIQDRANDSRMKAAMGQFAKAIMIWSNNNGDVPRGGWSSTVALSGTNCTDGTGGWVFAGAYVCSLEDILLAQNLIPTNFTHNLPPNKPYNASTTGRYAVMFYPCGSNTGRFALYWHLRSPSTEDAASLTAAEAAGCPSSPRTSYYMKAAQVLQLN